MTSSANRKLALTGIAVGALVVSAAVATAAPSQAAAGCQVTYAVQSQWQGGFTANVTVTNLGDAVTSWTVAWAFGAGQAVTQMWDAVAAQSGSQVSANNMPYNATIAANGSVSFGFNGSWSGSNPVPASFSMNGVQCTGGTAPPTTAPPTSTPPTSTPPTSSPPGTTPPATTAPSTTAPPGALPSTFRWSSSGALAGPRPDASHNIVSIKDFSVVRFNDRWLIYATTANTAGAWSLETLSFADWPQAASAQQTFLDTASAIGSGYRAAPQLFFFAPQNLWYLVYQTGPPTYSTSTDPSNPRSWSAPRTFIATEPAIVTQNKGPGGWIDFWVICDSANCYLFFSDDNGHLYRAQTTLANFPNGFGNTVIAMSDSRFSLFEGSNVYKVAGRDQFLLIVEAIGSTGRRYFRSWTSTSLTGSWTPLAATENQPLAGRNNVTFSGTPWTQDISHGEMVRANNDQTLTINPCHLQYVYQGMDPAASGDYSQLPWRMGLLTQTNSTC